MKDSILDKKLETVKWKWAVFSQTYGFSGLNCPAQGDSESRTKDLSDQDRPLSKPEDFTRGLEDFD